ncbi:MAG: dihydroneopterin aldolase [Bacteroidales bacterium]|nr:dihydroneopterin aldolase [Bacteroidales bacterium]
MAYIEIEDMQFYAYHGCFDEESQIGTNFRVDIKIQTDTTVAQSSDNIDDTVNYLEIYQSVKRQMSIRSHLLENVADRIASAVLSDFPLVEHIWVKVTKLNPPLGGKMYGVSLAIEKERGH